MIDIKFLRENPDVVKENIKKKFQDQKLPLVDEVIKLDKESRELTLKCDEWRNSRNTISKQIGGLMAKGEKVEAEKLSIAWDVKRELSKINYKIHTDAVKEFLITPELTPQEMSYTYASEADVLNMALFGKTAVQWRNETGTKGMSPNIRDFASAEELVVLINLEDTNADLIRQGINQIDRLKILREKAYRQLQTLINNQKAIESLKTHLIANDKSKGFVDKLKQ